MPIYKTPKGLLYFAHVPRAAGSSVENHLKGLFGAPAFLDRGHWSRENAWTESSPQHVTVEDLSPLFPPNFFDHAFAIVRHPVDRIVSVFRYQKYVEGRIADGVDINAWLASLKTQDVRGARDHDNHALPQSAFVPRRARLFRLEDGLGRVERYLSRRFEMPTSARIRRLNKSPDTTEPVHLTEESLALIRDLYAEDFERFDYRLEDARILQRASTKNQDGLRVALRVAAPSPDKGVFWGEHAFADGLAGALSRQGVETRIDYVGAWNKAEPGEVDLVLRGHGYRKKVFLPKPGRASIMWNIYPAWPDFEPGELAAFDRVFVASAPAAREMAAEAELLPQAFDATRMAPVARPKRDALVLVANNHERRRVRRIARWALAADVPLKVWGAGWDDTPVAPFVVAESLPNEQLAEAYGHALAVLNDHAHSMSAAGFPSNRLFDALACAAPVISDRVAWLPADLSAHVTQVDGADELAAAVQSISASFDQTRPERLALAEEMRRTHSFDARAEEFARAIRTSGARRQLEAAE